MQIRFWFITIIFIALFKICFPKDVISQDAIFSQFYANPLYLNPALAGTKICPRLDINYRNQPYPEFGHLSTYSVSYQRHWRPVSGGIGLLVTSEDLGQTLRRHFIGGIYSYHTQLSRRKHLSFGVNASYYRKDLRWDNLVFPDQYVPETGETVPTHELQPENVGINAFDLTSGVLLYSDNFFAGIVGHHLTQPKETFYSNARIPLKFTLHGGMQFDLYSRRNDLPDIELSPNIIMQHQDDFLRINYGIYFDAKPLTSGIWFRHDFKDQKTLIFLLGLSQDNYRIGYSYDYSLSGIYGGIGGIHEISVSLNFDCSRQKLEYKILNCPNF